MKGFKFTEIDRERLAMDRTMPLETMIDLLCATESALNSMMTQIESMAKTMEAISRLQEEWLPQMTDELKKTRRAIRDNTQQGVDQAKEVNDTMGELVDEFRAFRSSKT